MMSFASPFLALAAAAGSVAVLASGSAGSERDLILAGAAAVASGGLAWQRGRRKRDRGAAMGATTAQASPSGAQIALSAEPFDPSRRHARSLEKILAVSTRLYATQGHKELADKIVAAVAEIGGYRRVELFLWLDAAQAFVPRAFVGIDSEEIAALAAAPMVRATFTDMIRPCHRYGNTFLVPAVREDETPQSSAAADGRHPWLPGQTLVAPLIAASGDHIGFLRLASPDNDMVPSLAEIGLLEFLVQQAATALESAEIYDRLAAKNAQLSLASKKLDSLAKMKRNFVANVSHELRTPLTSISAYSELLQDNLSSLSGEALSEFLRVIHSESRKLTGVINDILEVSNMENGRPMLSTAHIDLAALVRRLAESWHVQAAERDLVLSVEAQDATIQLPGDEMLIRQMLAHLVDNAMKFTPGGGHVRVAVRETGTAVRLTVEDAGIGIPEDKLGEIFETFYQVDGSATRPYNGQGVGLAICRDIVQHHDGRIWAENMKPAGARFTVLLPRRTMAVLNGDHDPSGSVSLEPGEFLQRVMNWVSESVGVRTTALMVPDPDGDGLIIRAAIGLPATIVQGTRLRMGTGYAGRVWATGRTLLIPDLARYEGSLRDVGEYRYSTPSLLCVPLREGNHCLGVLTVNNKVDGSPLNDDDRLLLESMAPHVSAMLARYEKWRQEGQGLLEVRQTLRATTMVGRPHGASLHDICREICLATARRLGFADAECSVLAFALQFYDVGLSRVPPQLLSRPERLNEAEEIVVRRHVEAGLEVIEPLGIDAAVKRLILHHHENYDGTGYPAQVAGESIPVGARLLRLSDTLAAMLSRRPWRGAWSLDKALAELTDHAGSRYCPRLVPVFVAETELRRDRILALQIDAGDAGELRRPVLDREGMVSLVG